MNSYGLSKLSEHSKEASSVLSTTPANLMNKLNKNLGSYRKSSGGGLEESMSSTARELNKAFL